MLKKLLATTALSALLIGPAFAQDTQPTDDPIEAPADAPDASEDPMTDPLADPADDPMADPADDPMADPVDDPMTEPADDPMADPADDPMADDMDMDTTPNGDTVLADDVIGADLLGFDGEVIATVDDVVLDATGGIESILVDVGGFLGLGATTVEIPFADVTVETDEAGDTVLRSQLTSDDLEAMPEYEEEV
ncbi:PRC-barrel domain-containing protein [Roseinatronobacter monicus]|uniref:PRC-barrel domain-containing protein n=1 Tax=Roseinatronobacter monicus TaxID=393481 RepID=UPI003F2C23DB